KDVQNINVKLYPNPNNGSFYIKGSIKNPPTQNISFSIRDIVGKTLYEGEIPVDDNNFYHEIDIKDLNPGVYLLHIKNEDEEHYLKWVKE
ncbi:MAG TPA: T9SS type A sorting domain-containing protein, partial [Chitinophagaceae bacterium]|nr:T9SS type A sorting domain-containing protein [Chitinophagaceae bacterium]